MDRVAARDRLRPMRSTEGTAALEPVREGPAFFFRPQDRRHIMLAGLYVDGRVVGYRSSPFKMRSIRIRR